MKDEMPDRFDPIETISDLDRLFEESAQRVVILFNHDPWCPISKRAFREMTRLEHDAAMVDVSRAHDVTAAIAQRTGVRHESPQVIVLHDGREIWNASHFAITADAVDRAAGLTEPTATPDD